MPAAYRWLLLVFIAAAVLAGTWSAGWRHTLEKENREVLLSIDSRLLMQEEFGGGRPGSRAVQELKEAGCTAVSVHPLTLMELRKMGYLYLFDAPSLRGLQKLGLLDDFPEIPEGTWPGANGPTAGLYVLTGERELHERLQSSFAALFGSDSLKAGTVSGSGGERSYLIFIEDRYGQAARETPLTWPLEQMKSWSDDGLALVALFFKPPFHLPAERYWGALALQLEEMGAAEGLQPAAVAFPSDGFTYPAPGSAAGRLFTENELPLAAVEFTAGIELDRLAAEARYRLFLAHQVPTAELAELGETRSRERFLRAVRERGARVLLLNPYPGLDRRGELDSYRQFVGAISGSLLKAGYTVGNPSPYPYLVVPAPLRAVLSAGIAAAFFWCAGLFWDAEAPPRKKKKKKKKAARGAARGTVGGASGNTAWSASGGAAGGGCCFITGETAAGTSSGLPPDREQLREARRREFYWKIQLTASAAAIPAAAALPFLLGGGAQGLSPLFISFQKGAALLAALVFPLLGVLLFLEPALRRSAASGGGAGSRGRLGAVVGGFLAATLFTTGGALAASGMIGDTPYMLKVETFTGVKLAQLGPFILLGLFLCLRRGRGLVGETRAALETAIKAWHLLLLAAGAGALLVYLGRGGDIPFIPVTEVELALRRYLEILLEARPRFKEFLIGHPGLFLGAALAVSGVRGGKVLGLLLALLGQVSVFNTFMHLHSPVLISLLRTGYGVLLGLPLGLVLYFAARRLLALPAVHMKLRN